MSTAQQARLAKSYIAYVLNRPSWGRGVGLTCAGMWGGDSAGWGRPRPGEPCVPAVAVGVQAPEHIELARRRVGDTVYGVPVVFDVVGDIIAQVGSQPSSPPPFGQPEGHLGGSYDWWWWTFGRPAGMPYSPT